MLASFIGTIAGFGSSALMVAVLLFFFPLGQVLLLVGIIHWFNDLWEIIMFRKGFHWKLILTFGIPGLIAAVLGARLIIDAPEELLIRTLGVLLLIYVIYLLTKHTFKIPGNNATAVTGGALSGLLAGVLGIGGPIRSAALLAFNLPKSAYLTTVGAVAMLVDTSRIATYLLDGQRLETTILYGLIIFIPITYLGALLAKQVINRINQQTFTTLVAALLGVIALKFLIIP
ncbi:MAG: sulfite exporter TauE/SafE family protein [Candidatus Kerfeldbacteria bacterium]